MNKDYIKRINTAIEFINSNLDKDLNLSIISKVAFYSPFHFHRLFKSVTGESLNKYVLRLRIERSAYQIKKDRNLNISEIALNNGFESNSNFSKTFKKYYGVSPTFLKYNTSQFSKIRQINSKNGKQQIKISNDICIVNSVKHMAPNTPVSIKEIQAKKVAYVSHVGAFDKIGNAYTHLMRWATINNIHNPISITRFHDSPEVTDLSQIRQSACVEITGEFKSNDKVLFSIIDGGKHAVGKFDLDMNDLENAWQYMIVWVAEQGLVPDEKKSCFEMYLNHLAKTPTKKHIIEIYVPIK